MYIDHYIIIYFTSFDKLKIEWGDKSKFKQQIYTSSAFHCNIASPLDIITKKYLLIKQKVIFKKKNEELERICKDLI